LRSIDEIAENCMRIARERTKNIHLVPEQLQAPRPEQYSMAQVSIPARYRECSLEGFVGNPPLVSKIRAAMDRGESLVLIGNTGCGKTHMAIAAMRHGIESRRIQFGAVFIPVPELLLKIRSTFRDGAAETEGDVIDNYGHCPFLILDDLGAEKTSELTIATLELIIDRRVREDRQTIITTNLTLEEIEGMLSARIASRLAMMNPVRITMPDYRKRRKSP